MKKLVSYLVVMAMVLSLTAALAETTADTNGETETNETDVSTEINWTDIETQSAELVEQGDFVSFDGLAYKMWIPSAFTSAELTDDEIEQGYIAYYTTEDEAEAISVMNVAADGMTLEDYKVQLEQNGATEVEFVTVNGISAVSYVLAESDTACIAIVTDNDSIFEVCGAPQSDEDFAAVLAIAMASIQIA